MTTLEAGFEDGLREAALDEAERELVGREDNIFFRLIQAIHDRLRQYAARFNYDVQSTIDSLGQVEVDRESNSITARVGWSSSQMSRWEFGTTAHTIQGDPILSFVWADTDTPGDDPPQWVKEEFDQARDARGRFQSGWRVFFSEVEVDGIPPSRAIRDTLNELRAGGPGVLA